MNLQKERETAIKAVLDACKVTQAIQANLVKEDTLIKKDKSPVTVADMASQAVVIHHLKQAFPNDAIVGEETSADLKENDQFAAQVEQAVHQVKPGLDRDTVIHLVGQGSHEGGGKGRFWTLDPIDGTKGFLRNDQYAVALALIEDGEVLLGLMGCPNLPMGTLSNTHQRGCLFVAEVEQPAHVRSLEDPAETVLRVSHINDITQSVFCESVESGHSDHSNSAKIARQLGIHTEPARIDSQCKYGVVSRGEASIYLRLPSSGTYQEKIWDHAAGQLVVKQAGGRVTDIFGKELDFSQGRTLQNNKGIIASNGTFHDEIVSTVRSVLGV